MFDWNSCIGKHLALFQRNYGGLTVQTLKGKDKASSLDIAPLTILNSGTLQPRKWQLTGNDCSIPWRTQ